MQISISPIKSPKGTAKAAAVSLEEADVRKIATHDT